MNHRHIVLGCIVLCNLYTCTCSMHFIHMLASFFQLRIVKLAQTWSTMRTLLSIIFGAFGALMNLVVILIIIMFIFAVLGNQLFGPFYERYKDLHNYPELADYGGELPRLVSSWGLNDLNE